MDRIIISTIICICVIIIFWIISSILANAYFKAITIKKADLISLCEKYTEICNRLEKDIEESKNILRKIKDLQNK